MLRLLSFIVLLATWWIASLLAGTASLPPPPTVLAVIIAEARSGALCPKQLRLLTSATIVKQRPVTQLLRHRDIMPLPPRMSHQAETARPGILSSSESSQPKPAVALVR